MTESQAVRPFTVGGRVKNSLKQGARAVLTTAFLTGLVTVGILLLTILQHPNPVKTTDIAETSLWGVSFFTSTMRVDDGYFAGLEFGLGVFLLMVALPLLVGVGTFIRNLYRDGTIVTGVDT